MPCLYAYAGVALVYHNVARVPVRPGPRTSYNPREFFMSSSFPKPAARRGERPRTEGSDASDSRKRSRPGGREQHKKHEPRHRQESGEDTPRRQQPGDRRSSGADKAPRRPSSGQGERGRRGDGRPPRVSSGEDSPRSRQDRAPRPRREEQPPHSYNAAGEYGDPREEASGYGAFERTGQGAGRFSAADGAEDGNAHLLPGIKPVLELLERSPERVDAVFLRKGRHGREMERVVDLCRSAGVRFSLLETVSFARVYAGKSQGVVARLYETGFVELDSLLDSVMDAPLPLILALDQVQDPGNAGTLARTLYALGGAGMIAPRHNGVYLGAAAAKAAAGALERLPVAKAANLGQALEAAKKRGFTIYGAASGAEGDGGTARHPAVPAVDVFDLAPRLPAILVLGGEEGGLRPGMEKRCDMLVRIPMLRDFDSLNVAQAGAVIIGWFSRHAPGTGR